MKSFATLLLLLAVLLLARFTTRAQSVGIGTTTPDASAALDVAGTARGLLVPRLTAAQRTAIAAPAKGLLVFQTDGAQPGFWFNAGTGAAPAWTFFNPSADNLGNHTATGNLNLAGNALVGTGASIGTAVGLGLRADGGLNLGQNAVGQNIFLGYQAGAANTTGNNNQFSGYQSGLSNTEGSRNQFSGYQSGFSNTIGVHNQFSGYQSGSSNNTGDFNQFSGYQSGLNNTMGFQNLFVGFRAGFSNTTGSRNLAFGFGAGPATGNLTNAGAIGNFASVSQNNSLVLGGTGLDAVRVGIGTPAPAARLHVYGSGPAILRVQSSDGFGEAGLDFWSDPQGSANEWRPVAIRSTDAGNFTGQLAFYTNGTGFANRQASVEQMRLVNGGLAIGTTAVGSYRLYVAGTAGATGGFFNTSDERLKTDIRPLTGALALVQALHGRRYRWNARGVARGGTAGQEQVGLLAQELAAVLPELVGTGPDGYLAVNYAQLAPVLIEAIKEQQRHIETLQTQNAALLGRTAYAAADHAALLRLQAQVARLLGADADAAAQGPQAQR